MPRYLGALPKGDERWYCGIEISLGLQNLGPDAIFWILLEHRHRFFFKQTPSTEARCLNYKILWDSYIYIYTYVCAYVCACQHNSTHTHTHVYMHTYIHVCISIFEWIYIYICIIHTCKKNNSYANTFPCQMDMHVCIQIRMEGCACFFNCLHFIIQLWRCFTSRISSCYVEYDCLSSCDDMSNIQLLSLFSCVPTMWCPLVADWFINQYHIYMYMLMILMSWPQHTP